MFSIKIKNINFFSRYIVWAADCLLSVLATSFSFLFFHYLMKVDTDVTTDQRKNLRDSYITHKF